MKRRHVILFSMALFVAGCADYETTAPKRDLRPRASLVNADQLVVYKNTQKYKNTSKKAATGRSGTATLTVLAMAGKNGQTDVAVNAGAPGSLAKAQFKSFSAEGDHYSTFNRNGLSSANLALSLQGHPRGTRLQVQANIRGVDGKRTDVVTVDETVKYRPDVSVTNVSAPDEALVNSAVSVVATVQELKGDLGANGDCILEVDGIVVDQANGIWVDAAGAVSCAFNATFASTGTKQLTVKVTGVNPGDFDADNNAGSTSIEIIDPQPVSNFRFYAQAYDYSHRNDYSHSYRWRRFDIDESREYSRQEIWTHDLQQIHVNGWTPEFTSFPMNFSITLTSAGQTIYSVADQLTPDWTYNDSWSEQSCANRYQQVTFTDNKGQTWWYAPWQYQVCTYRRSYDNWQETHFWVNRMAGDVTYTSRGYDRYYRNGNLVWDNTYYLNRDMSGTIAPRQTWGSDIEVEATLTASDNVARRLQTTIPLAPFQDSWQWRDEYYCGNPYRWDNRPYDPSYGEQEWCTVQSGYNTGRRGFVSGAPTP